MASITTALAAVLRMSKERLKKEVILIIAAVLAGISAVFVRPDIQYFSYPDYSVLVILFGLMIVVAGLRKVGAFDLLTQRLLARVKSLKLLIILLVNCAFVSALFLTNDVAVLVFVPLTIGILAPVGRKTVVFAVVIETLAANLGSMLTPIGNPQNLYLYSYYQMHILEFFKYVLPVGVAGYFVLMVIVLVCRSGGAGVGGAGAGVGGAGSGTRAGVGAAIRPTTGHPVSGGPGGQPLDQARVVSQGLPKIPLIYYVCLFLLCVAVVIRILDYRVALIVILAATLIVDRRLLQKVDYGLLLTFVCFFVFVGNLERIDPVKNTLSLLLQGRVFITSVLSSQVISNVPAAMMISRFTTDVQQLLLGVNIGGLGTPVASLVSLIAFRLYAQSPNAAPRRFLGVFTLYNILVLLLLLLFSAVFLL